MTATISKEYHSERVGVRAWKMRRYFVVRHPSLDGTRHFVRKGDAVKLAKELEEKTTQSFPD